MAMSLLVVGADTELMARCKSALPAGEDGYCLEAVSDGAACLAAMRQRLPGAVLLDARESTDEAMAWLRQIGHEYPDVAALMLVARDDDGAIAEAIRFGARHCVVVDAIAGGALHEALLDCARASRSAPEEAVLVLLVDDNPDDRERYIRQLRKNTHINYRYVEAEGYTAMMAFLEKTRPDCVLLDYSLPGRSGLDILKEIMPRYQYLPVIVMTGHGNESIAVQSIKEGAQHYLVKSEVSEEMLHTHIASAIKNAAMEQERSALIQQLMESNIALERFAYVASHDLQEPIRMINNFGRILLSEYQGMLDADGREYLSMVTESGERMRDMVNDLLDYSRMGHESATYQLYDANQALLSALDNLKALIEEQKAVITHDALPQLQGNPLQLMRLLQNLIANAIKYQPKGNVPRIHVGVQDSGNFWEIFVRDNGIGIDPRFQQQIFEPFRRLHHWDVIKGSGLGLSICRKLAEVNGGALSVASTPGEGSVFTVTLPKPQIMKEAV